MNDPSLGLEEPTLSILWPLAGMIIDPVCVTASHFMSAFNIPQRLDNVVLLSSIINQGGVDEAMRGNTWSNSSASDCANATASRVWGKRVTAGTADKLAAASLVAAALSAAAACLAVTKAETRPTESQGTLSVPSCPTGCSHPAPGQPCLSKVQHLDRGPPWGHVWYLAHSEGYSTAVIGIRSRRCLLALKSWLLSWKSSSRFRHIAKWLRYKSSWWRCFHIHQRFVCLYIKGFGLRTSYFNKCTWK